MTIYPSGLPGRKKNIEWSQLSWNWMSGCDGIDGVHCRGCYAKCRANRMRGRFGYPLHEPFQVVLHPDKLFGDAPETLPAWTKQQIPMIGGPFNRRSTHPLVRKTPTVYFNVSMGDWMYAEWKWRKEALRIMRACPRHIFVTLTKQYDKLWEIVGDSPKKDPDKPYWRTGNEIPKNVIVGISVTKEDQVHGIDELRKVPALVRLVCFEPLLEDLSEDVNLNGIGWIIIGKRTRQGRTPEFRPEKAWVDALIAKAREQEIPVFLKPNLDPDHEWYPEPIEETPYEHIRDAFRLQETLI